MIKVFITGVAGFAGGFLCEHILKVGGFEVFGTYLSDEQLKYSSHIKDKVKLRKLNLLDAGATYNLVKEVNPDYVFHLAAITSPSASFENPSETITNNIEAQVNLLEAIRKTGINPSTLIVSSADAYGAVDKENLPIDENTPFRPVNPYAVSKIAQDFLGLQYFLSYGLKIIRVRPFNHIGPRQSPRFVVSYFAQQIAQIEKGGKENVIKVGDLSTKRDFTDVRDMMAAYLLALQKGEAGQVYNIGRGISYRISEILDKLLSLSSVKIKVEIDKSLFRPKDEPELRCDNRSFVKKTGWEPKIDIEKTLKDTLDYFRNIN